MSDIWPYKLQSPHQEGGQVGGEGGQGHRAVSGGGLEQRHQGVYQDLQTILLSAQLSVSGSPDWEGMILAWRECQEEEDLHYHPPPCQPCRITYDTYNSILCFFHSLFLWRYWSSPWAQWAGGNLPHSICCLSIWSFQAADSGQAWKKLNIILFALLCI